MLIQQRRGEILNLISQQQKVTVNELTSLLNVSSMTIWRDLKELEKDGKLQRVHGGALKNNYELNFNAKQSMYSKEKEKIAKYVARNFIQEGETITLEGGTTVSYLVPFLNVNNLTLLTNSLYVLNLTSEYLPNINLLSCGGILRENSNTFVGPEAEKFFLDFYSDKFFLSASGLTNNGITDPNPLEIQVKKSMAKNAKKCFLLIDSSKLYNYSLSPSLPLEEIDAIITDKKFPQHLLNSLKKYNLEIFVAN